MVIFVYSCSTVAFNCVDGDGILIFVDGSHLLVNESQVYLSHTFNVLG